MVKAIIFMLLMLMVVVLLFTCWFSALLLYVRRSLRVCTSSDHSKLWIWSKSDELLMFDVYVFYCLPPVVFIWKEMFHLQIPISGKCRVIKGQTEIWMPSQVEQKSHFNDYCWLFESVLLFVLALRGQCSNCAEVVFNYHTPSLLLSGRVSITMERGSALSIYYP